MNLNELEEWCGCSLFKPISQLRFDYDTTTIRRYHDAFDYNRSDRNYDLRSIRLRYDYNTTTTKNRHVHFLLASNRVEWKQARAIRRSRIVVVSQSNRNFDHFCGSRMRRVSSYMTYRSLVVVESQLWYRLRYDYDPTTTYRARLFPFDAIRREQQINVSVFRRSLVVVVSQSNRNFDHFRCSRLRRGVIVS